MRVAGRRIGGRQGGRGRDGSAGEKKAIRCKAWKGGSRDGEIGRGSENSRNGEREGAGGRGGSTKENGAAVVGRRYSAD